MVANVYGIITIIVGIVGIGWILWMMRDGDTARVHEDDARRFFDERGHWPDETPEDALERRRTAAPAPAAPVSKASSDGLV